ncbi:MAG TPA: helix-turn-helix domain-containing protein [Puia sp.]|nr:helix-turn-helix domain-containing protein [Puia sp.]
MKVKKPAKVSSKITSRHVSIFVPAGDFILSSVVGSYKVLTTVNSLVQQQHPGSPPPFMVQLVGLTKETNLYGGAFNICPHTTIDKIDQTDLVIIPAISGDYATEIKRNQPVLSWITKQYKQGAEIASLCTGSFILAATGLLKGKKTATHWIAFDAFRKMYPEIELVKSVVHEEQGICSSGGAYSFLNLILHLVEKYVSHEMAVQCSKIFEIEINRHSQASFSIFSGFKMHEDDAVMQAQQFIEENYADRISVDELANRSLLSRRNFERRFKKATQYSPAEYMQYLKIEAARRQLESSRYHINEVMYAVGYNDTRAFRSTFKKITGLSPLEYRNRFQAKGFLK